jgi:predicted RNA methylase
VAVTLNPTPDAVDAVAVAARISEAEGRLRTALLAGDPTRGIHAELAALRAEAARIAAADADARAAAEAEAARVRQERVTQTAAAYAADIMRRLEARLVVLAPPPFPTPATTGTPTR